MGGPGGKPASAYRGRPARAFWSAGVAGRAALDQPDIYRPKFRIARDTRVFTAGSCFAQHLGQALKRAGIHVIDEEPALRGMPARVARELGYGVYAARFGNIYTVRQFRQLVEELLGRATPALPVWDRDGRFWDAMRPGVEPDGLARPELVGEMRQQHLAALAAALHKAEVIVFTLGMTEAWEHRDSGTVYPTAPGTIAGSHDPGLFAFRNQGVAEILEDFTALESMVAGIAPDARWLLTVSPVPLAATATDAHVLPATVRSKSVLRVAAEMLSEGSDRIDYFPSYELVMSPAHDPGPFTEDLRTVRPDVVDAVTGIFLAAHGLSNEDAPVAGDTAQAEAEEAACEDILLDAFRP